MERFILSIFACICFFPTYGQIECVPIGDIHSLLYECDSIHPNPHSLEIMEKKIQVLNMSKFKDKKHYFRIGIPDFFSPCEKGTMLGYRRIEYLSSYLRKKYPFFNNVIILVSDHEIMSTFEYGSDVVGLLYTFPLITCD